MEVYKLIEYLISQKRSIYKDNIDMLMDAEKFLFVKSPAYTDDVLNGAALFTRQLFAFDIFPLPYDMCLFELHNFRDEDVTIDTITWILTWKELVENSRSDWAVYFEAFVCFGGVFIPMGCLGKIHTDKYNEDDSGKNGWFEIVGIDPAVVQGEIIAKDRPDDFVKLLEDSISVWPGVSLERDYAVGNALESGVELSICKTMGIIFQQLLYSLGLLSTDGIIQNKVYPVKKFINSKRMKSGKPPIEFEHKVVEIDPMLLRIPGARLGGTHASPRLHMRRGHVRRLSEERTTFVRPHLVGRMDRGVITHEYKIESGDGG